MSVLDLVRFCLQVGLITKYLCLLAILSAWLFVLSSNSRRRESNDRLHVSRNQGNDNKPGDVRTRSLPPGPRGWPLIGYLWHLGDNPHVTLTELSHVYGDVFTIRLGSRDAVIVSGSETIGQLLTSHGAALADRPPFECFRHYSGGTSISFSAYTQNLRLHRKLAANAIRHLVDGRLLDLEKVLQTELGHLDRVWRTRSGEGFDPSADVTLMVASVLYSFCFGESERLADNAPYRQLLTSENPTTKLFSAGSHVDLMPWLRRFSKRAELNSATERMDRFLELNDRQMTCFRSVPCIASKLLSLWRRPPSGDRKSPLLSRRQVENTPIEFLSAGTETSTATLLWLLRHMAEFPDVQRLVQRELDDVIGGGGGGVRIGHLDQLPYTRACVAEAMRLEAIVPFGLPHTARTDVTIGDDYVIPAGTLLLINLWSAGRDVRVWSDPDDFRPERFLRQSPDGAPPLFDHSLARKFYPFGVGRRRCVGERLGGTQVFFMFAYIMANFNVTFDTEDSKVQGRAVFGDVMKPAEFRIRVKPRT